MIKKDNKIYPEVDPVLLTTLMDLYSRYTGYQIAECIKVIRTHLEKQRIDEEINLAELKLDLTHLHEDEILPGDEED